MAEQELYAWRYNERGEHDKRKKEVKAHVETGLRLKEGTIKFPAGAQNLREQILDSQIVD